MMPEEWQLRIICIVFGYVLHAWGFPHKMLNDLNPFKKRV